MSTLMITVDPPMTGGIRTLATSNTHARVANHGAQVLSWTCRGKERLFFSAHSTSTPGQAMRGGIPVIFPQFAEAGTGLRHGFARLVNWESHGAARAFGGPVQQARFVLLADEHTRKTFPYDFRAHLTVALTHLDLYVTLEIENLDTRDFSFTAALHTYLRVADIDSVQLLGLEGMRYLDSASGGRQEVGTDEPLRFDGELDRIYPGASGDLLLQEGRDTLRIRSLGFSDTVVWNPGRALAARMNDLGGDEFRQFACVESGVVNTPQIVRAGSRWRAGQRLSVLTKQVRP